MIKNAHKPAIGGSYPAPAVDIENGLYEPMPLEGCKSPSLFPRRIMLSGEGERGLTIHPTVQGIFQPYRVAMQVVPAEMRLGKVGVDAFDALKITNGPDSLIKEDK